MPLKSIITLLEASSQPDMQLMQDALHSAEFSEDWIKSHVPNPMPEDTYGRNLLHAGHDFEIVLATWPVGIATKIHNHGAYASHGMVRVLKGDIYNHVYTPDGVERVQLSYKEVYHAGQMISVPKGLLHAMGNEMTDDYAMSIHIYSPRLVDVTFWDSQQTLEVVGQLVG